MSSLLFDPLPSLDKPDGRSPRLNGLPPLVDKLYAIPALADRPYRLRLESAILKTGGETRNAIGARETSTIAKDLGNIRSESAQVVDNASDRQIDPNLSTNAVDFIACSKDEPTYKNKICSWDTLRPDYRRGGPHSPFLTEQSPSLIVAARRAYAFDTYDTARKNVIKLSVGELIDLLYSTFAGCSSNLHVWDAKDESFIPRCERSENGNWQEATMHIILDGIDDKTSEEYINHCVMYGTLIRRLEDCIARLRKKAKNVGSTLFAFAYALASTLSWVKKTMIDYLDGLGSDRKSRICDIWFSVRDNVQILLTLADLCQRSPHLKPGAYGTLPSSPTELLSHIYVFLLAKIEQCAPRVIRAIISYILTVTSRPYFQHIGQVVGLENLEYTLNLARKKAQRALDEAESVPFGEENDEADEDLVFEEDSGAVTLSSSETFPSFVSDELKEAILRARRSIKILSSPELKESEAPTVPEFHKLEWVWTDKDISVRAVPTKKDEHENDEVSVSLQVAADDASVDNPTRQYKPELAGLAVFDLQPGSNAPGGLLVSRSSEAKEISAFIESYPDRLPPLTPTLPLLASRILSPILLQAAILGQAALRIFFGPRSTLHFRAHIVFLRAYVLLGSPEFKSRLSAALFSDSEMQEDDKAEENTMAMTIRTRDRNQNWRKTRAKKSYASIGVRHEDRREWAVGLAYGLIDRAQWPPGGSELSFYLRRVIMDSLESVRAVGDPNHSQETYDHRSTQELGVDGFWDEAESRLGFAIRDLPIGTGRDKWLDPTCIEALDFLIMDYKPPRPLNCLITAEIMSKYQRIFTFLLRLLRVENVMRLLYRLSRPSERQQLFGDPSAENLFRHFRFSTQVFVSVFSAYVADTAIGGNINAFLARLRAAESEAAVLSPSSSRAFSTSKSQSTAVSQMLSTPASASASSSALASASVITDISHHDAESDTTRTEIADDGTMLTYSRYFADVFALMQRHSRALDDILAACLLRTAQRAVWDVLRTCLELALEFGVLVGNVFRGLVSQDVGAERMASLYYKFRNKVTVLIKALKKYMDNDAMARSLDTPAARGREAKLPAAPGGMGALADVLLRLGDVADILKGH